MHRKSALVTALGTLLTSSSAFAVGANFGLFGLGEVPARLTMPVVVPDRTAHTPATAAPATGLIGAAPHHRAPAPATAGVAGTIVTPSLPPAAPPPVAPAPPGPAADPPTGNTNGTGPASGPVPATTTTSAVAPPAPTTTVTTSPTTTTSSSSSSTTTTVTTTTAPPGWPTTTTTDDGEFRDD